MVLLGEDSFGIWLGPGFGRKVRKGTGEWRDLGRDFVQLIVPDAWWTAMFNDYSCPIQAYVDIVTPPVWRHAQLVTMIDLDLDVVRMTGGRVTIEDEDEFLLHQRVLEYPREWVQQARHVTNEVVAMLVGERPPLIEAGRQWLAKLTTRDVGDGRE
jgi:hypothetical protein